MKRCVGVPLPWFVESPYGGEKGMMWGWLAVPGSGPAAGGVWVDYGAPMPRWGTSRLRKSVCAYASMLFNVVESV